MVVDTLTHYYSFIIELFAVELLFIIFFFQRKCLGPSPHSFGR